MFFGQRLDTGGWIGAHGQQTDQRRTAIALLPHFLHVQNHAVRELLAQRVGDVLARLRRGPVRTPGPDEQQTPEYVQRRVVPVRYHFLFRRFFVEPLTPLFLIPRHLNDEGDRNNFIT